MLCFLLVLTQFDPFINKNESFSIYLFVIFFFFSGFIPEGRIYTHYLAAVGEHGLSWGPLFALVILGSCSHHQNAPQGRREQSRDRETLFRGYSVLTEYCTLVTKDQEPIVPWENKT